MNRCIIEKLEGNRQVTFMSADKVLNLKKMGRTVMGSDGYHLSPIGSRRMTEEWIRHILNVHPMDPLSQKDPEPKKGAKELFRGIIPVNIVCRQPQDSR